MAKMNIQIEQQEQQSEMIKLIRQSENSCFTLFTLDITTEPAISMLVELQRDHPHDYDVATITMSSTQYEIENDVLEVSEFDGTARMTVRIGNTQDEERVNSVNLIVTDQTNNVSDEITLQRFVVGQRC